MSKPSLQEYSAVPLIPGGSGKASRRALKAGAGPSKEPSQGEDRAASTGDTADYLAEISAGLAGLARSSGLDLVAYLLEMSAEEARRHGRAGADAGTPSRRERPGRG
jgi:hypothetical protein